MRSVREEMLYVIRCIVDAEEYSTIPGDPRALSCLDFAEKAIKKLRARLAEKYYEATGIKWLGSGGDGGVGG